MGTTVLEAGPSPTPGVDVFAHCLGCAGRRCGGRRQQRSHERARTVPGNGERYTLTWSPGLLSREIQLNSASLALATHGAVPALQGAALSPGTLILPPASITFLALRGASNVTNPETLPKVAAS